MIDKITAHERSYMAKCCELDRLKKRAKILEDALELALSFAPKGPVPKGLFPTAYYTLNYHDECELIKRVDKAREALEAYRSSM